MGAAEDTIFDQGDHVKSIVARYIELCGREWAKIGIDRSGKIVFNCA
jgi:hypothetical protein